MGFIRRQQAVVESFPFRHVVLDDFLTDAVHDAVCAAFEKLLAEGTSETFTPSILSRFPGYDAYCWVFDPQASYPLNIFYSREWLSYFAGLFELLLTDEVVVEFHHHKVGSREDAWHDDFNRASFMESGRLANGVNPWYFQCNYMDGSPSRLADATPLLERVRAISFIYYFGRDEYRRGAGGETGLGIADTEAGGVRLFRAVEPLPNRLLAFEISDRSHHKFMTNRAAERNTIIGWFHATPEENLRRHQTSARGWTKGDIAGGKRSPEGYPLDEVIYE